MITVGVDLGSVHCGAVVAVDGRPTHASTIDVDESAVGPAAAELWAIIKGSGAERVAVEWAALHPGATPQQTAAMGRAHEVMAIVLDRVEQKCIDAGIAVDKIHVQTVRARIGVGWPKGEPRTAALTDRLVREALEVHIGEAMALLRDVHQRDAAAAALAAHIGEKPKARQQGTRKRYYTRKMGTKRVKYGHPSDAAFDALMREREANHGS